MVPFWRKSVKTGNYHLNTAFTLEQEIIDGKRFVIGVVIEKISHNLIVIGLQLFELGLQWVAAKLVDNVSKKVLLECELLSLANNVICFGERKLFQDLVEQTDVVGILEFR